MTTLRHWQSECIESAVDQFSTGQQQFLAMATPGAGKTIMAAALAKRLLDDGQIDLVFCLSPSIEVSQSFSQTLSEWLGLPVNGLVGSKGKALTYQSLPSITDDFWELFERFNVLVICDEVHHCSGGVASGYNIWGSILENKIKPNAKYILNLSGTPWRSDQNKISLVSYSLDENINVDYTYSLAQAVNDKVCRLPKIVALDSSDISVSEGNSSARKYEKIQNLLDQENIAYQSLLESHEIIDYMLSLATKRLSNLRKNSPKAGGLIVASNVKHAHAIYKQLVSKYKQSAVIVTYRSEGPRDILESFKYSDTQWIVSVGMVSEGTNIPRLEVCCHLSRIKTELYFRQVLGRVLRSTASNSDAGYLYILAEENLMKFAERVAEDLPGEAVLLKKNNKKASSSGFSSKRKTHSEHFNSGILIDPHSFSSKSTSEHEGSEVAEWQSSFTGFYEQLLNIQLRAI